MSTTMELIPTTAEGFQQQGFARFDNLLSPDEWSVLSELYDDLFADPTSHPNFAQLGGTGATGEQLMPQILAPHDTHPQLLATEYFQNITTLAKKLLGPAAALATSHMILKPAGSERDTPWHQDQSYHAPNAYFKKINFWLPLDGADIDDGCMYLCHERTVAWSIRMKMLVAMPRRPLH